MKIVECAKRWIGSTAIGERFLSDKRYRTVVKAVIGFILNLLFAVYNGVLGIISTSVMFVASSVYYLLLSAMRFSAVIIERKNVEQSDRKISGVIGALLIVLSVIFQVMVFVSMKYKTAADYGTIPMITIATFTFAKITMAIVTAVKHRNDNTILFKSINAIRYSEVAVSLLTMQQSMLVSFEGTAGISSLILNAGTGAGVCLLIFSLGIITINTSRKEIKNG